MSLQTYKTASEATDVGTTYADQSFLFKPCLSITITIGLLLYLYNQNSCICCFCIITLSMNKSETVQLLHTRCYFQHESLFIMFLCSRCHEVAAIRVGSCRSLRSLDISVDSNLNYMCKEPYWRRLRCHTFTQEYLWSVNSQSFLTNNTTWQHRSWAILSTHTETHAQRHTYTPPPHLLECSLPRK